MGKCRGFKPQGMVLNPIKRVFSSGPSILEKLQRDSRPTWEELRKMLKKKEESASEFLERYENEQFSGQLERYRNEKIEAQEREHLELVRREAKQRRKDREGQTNDGATTRAEETALHANKKYGSNSSFSVSSHDEEQPVDVVDSSRSSSESEGESDAHRKRRKRRRSSSSAEESRSKQRRNNNNSSSHTSCSISNTEKRDRRTRSRRKSSKKKKDRKEEKRRKPHTKKKHASTTNDSDEEAVVVNVDRKKNGNGSVVDDVEVIGTTRNNPYRLSKFFDAVKESVGKIPETFSGH